MVSTVLGVSEVMKYLIEHIVEFFAAKIYGTKHDIFISIGVLVSPAFILPFWVIFYAPRGEPPHLTVDCNFLQSAAGVGIRTRYHQF